jgi:hypothetical protein
VETDIPLVRPLAKGSDEVSESIDFAKRRFLASRGQESVLVD